MASFSWVAFPGSLPVADVTRASTTRTSMTDAIPEADRTALAARIPLQRLGTPEDIAYAACFLASDESSFITGTTLDVNGGLLMR